MSKIQSHVCPNCGAPLPLTDKKAFFCGFCGSPVTVSSESAFEQDPRRFGYEFEYGRYDAQNSMPGARLAEEIRRLIDPLEELNALSTRLAWARHSVEELTRELNQARNSLKPKLFLYGLPALCLAFLLLVRAPVLISLVTAAAVYGVFWLKNTISAKLLAKKLLASGNEMDELQSELDALNERYDFGLVPEEYRYREAMTYLAKVLGSGRAPSLQQAINLYENSLHQEQMLRLQEEQNALKRAELEVQRQQLNNQIEFNERQLEQQKKKNVNWGELAQVAGSIAFTVWALKGKKK